MIASSLFHFTKELDTLKLILENGIRSSYNFEEITDIGSEFKYIGIPMVCFCDIPLKFIKHHTAAYGQYGIAFKKEWAIENGIQPLTYRIENSSIAGMDNLLSLIQDGIKKINTNESDLDKKFAPIQDIKILRQQNIIFSKVFKGWDKKIKREVQFYKEREWRYVPKNCDVPTYKRISERRKKQLNKTLYNSNKANVFVKFEYDEIEHIILPNKVEATSMLNFFKTLKINGRKLKEIEKLKLAQKVIDLEPIDLDF